MSSWGRTPAQLTQETRLRRSEAASLWMEFPTTDPAAGPNTTAPPEGDLPGRASRKRLEAAELCGRHLVAPMHLEQTTGEAELTEVASVGPSDSCSAISGCCARTRVCVCVGLSWSSQVGVSRRHCQPGLISSSSIRGSVPVTQLTPRVALPCHFETPIKAKTSRK